jgi:hypothetical protein
MTLLNWSNDKIKRLHHKVYSLWEYVSIYFHKRFHVWYLFPDTLFPLSYRHLYQADTDIGWEYDPNKQTLTWSGSNVNQTEYSISWLSASTVSEKKEVDMDAFLSSLRIYTPEMDSIRLTILLQAWSIYDQHWWIQDPTNKIKWIDNEANEKECGVRVDYLVPITPVLTNLTNKKIEMHEKTI